MMTKWPTKPLLDASKQNKSFCIVFHGKANLFPDLVHGNHTMMHCVTFCAENPRNSENLLFRQFAQFSYRPLKPNGNSGLFCDIELNPVVYKILSVQLFTGTRLDMRMRSTCITYLR